MILSGKENDILLRLQSGKEQCIFGFMFGEPVLTVYNPDGSIAFTRPDVIDQISLSDVDIASEEGMLVYEWGWPGPDVTVYKISDYGRTWAFTKEELEVRT